MYVIKIIVNMKNKIYYNVLYIIIMEFNYLLL